MDIVSIATFLTGGSVVATLLTGMVKQVFATVDKKYGSMATQGVLLVVSIIVALLMAGLKLLPSEWLATAGGIFAGGIAIYEVGYKTIWLSIAPPTQDSTTTPIV